MEPVSPRTVRSLGNRHEKAWRQRSRPSWWYGLTGWRLPGLLDLVFAASDTIGGGPDGYRDAVSSSPLGGWSR